MQTIEVSRFGGPDVLEAREGLDPSPGPGQVLIGVEVIEVLFLDTQLRSGWGRAYFPLRPPWVPGTGVAGKILAVGADVTSERVGTPVVARTGNDGAYAELVVVDDVEAIRRPDDVDPAAATAALHDGPLALDRLDEIDLRSGTRVLVTAAAGSLGHWFIPLAKAAGATVTAVAGGPAKMAAVLALGADIAIDHREPEWAGRLGGPFDVVFDGAGGATGDVAMAATADGGWFSAHGAASGEFASTGESRGITTVGVDRSIGVERWYELTSRALSVIADGTVRPRVGQRVPLARAADAHRAIERREVVGKSVLTVGGSDQVP